MYVGTIIVVTLLSFHISNEVLAVLGGTAAVAMGFAMKDLVASVVAGVMIMMDRPFQVGDRVSFGGQYGDISNIGLRSVRMVTLDDNVITIPNNKFLTDITSCNNYGTLDMQVVIDFHIGVLGTFAEEGIQPPAILHRRIEDFEKPSETDLRIARQGS